MGTLVTLHDTRQYVGALGRWVEVPSALWLPLAAADLGADIARICLALGALAVLGGIAFGCIKAVHKVLGLLVKVATASIGLFGALAFIRVDLRVIFSHLSRLLISESTVLNSELPLVSCGTERSSLVEFSKRGHIL